MAKKYERKGEVFEVGFSPKGLEVSYKGEIGYVGVDRINGDLVGRPYTVMTLGDGPSLANSVSPSLALERLCDALLQLHQMKQRRKEAFEALAKFFKEVGGGDE